jgi:transcriptional regulator with XRE-family HTH domain
MSYAVCLISGTLLREARRRAGLSQPALARRARKPTSSIGRWERGEVVPSLETLRQLIRDCGLELRLEIVNGEPDGHDRTMIERALARTPAERVAAGVSAAAEIARFRAAARPRPD